MISGDPRLPQLSGEEAQEKYVPVSFYRRFQERFYALWRELAGSVASSGANSDITSINGLTTPLSVDQGGTGQTSFTNGQLLIGNTTGNTLTKSTLTQGTGISITNGNGSITISATGGGGSGDVLGPGAATDNAAVRFDGTTGELIQDSSVIIDDSGNISGGVWQGTAVAASYGGTGQSSYTVGDVLYASNTTTLTKLAGNTTANKQFLSQTGTGSVSGAPSWSAVTASDVGLGNVENTKLSTWAGSTNITTVGTVTSGEWKGTVISPGHGGTGVNNGTRTLTINSNSGTLAFSGASKTLTIADNASVSGTNTGDQVVPANTSATTNQFFTAYNSSTGAFTSARPTWANIDKSTSSLADITTRNHSDLSGVGTNTHAQIDTALSRLSTTSGTNTGDQTLNSLLPSQTSNSGKFLTTNGTDASWGTPAGGGTVTSVSITTANGVSGTVANSTTTPAITLSLGAITPTSVSTGALTATGNVSLDGGTFVFNESGADKDLRIEGDTDANLVFTDASTDRVGIGTNAPGYKLHVSGTAFGSVFATGVPAIAMPEYPFTPAAYSAGTTYAIDDIVDYNGTIYSSLQNSNTGNTPNTSAAYWSSSGSVGSALTLTNTQSALVHGTAASPKSMTYKSPAAYIEAFCGNTSLKSNIAYYDTKNQSVIPYSAWGNWFKAPAFLVETRATSGDLMEVNAGAFKVGSDYPTVSASAYDSGTTYSAGDVVSYGGSTYMSLKASNTNKTPGIANTSWWFAIGKYASQPLVGISSLANAQATSGTNRDVFGANIVARFQATASQPQDCVGIEVDIINETDANSTSPLDGGYNYTAFWAQSAGGASKTASVAFMASGKDNNGWYYGFHAKGIFKAWLANLSNTSSSSSANGVYVTLAGDDASNRILVANSGSTSNSDKFYVAGDGTAYFSGKVGIGDTSPGEKLEVTGNIRVTSGYGVSVGNATAPPAGGVLLTTNGRLETDGGTVYSYSIRDSTTASAANVYIDATNGFIQRSTSSLRYKRNVRDATNGLAKVMALRPVLYKGNGDLDTDRDWGGLIAEEVHEAGLAEFVMYRDGKPDGLAYGNMVALLVNAIKEQQAQIESLQQQVAALQT